MHHRVETTCLRSLMFQMNSFELLLDQDRDFKPEEQKKLLRNVAAAFAKLRQDRDVEERDADRDGNENDDLDAQLSGLDASLRQLTNRVEVSVVATACLTPRFVITIIVYYYYRLLQCPPPEATD